MTRRVMLCKRLRSIGLIPALFVAGSLHATDVPPQVVDLARQYLAASGAAEKLGLAARLDACGCDPESVVLALRPAPAEGIEPGYFAGEHFRVPELREKHPDDLLFYVVPESYRPDTPTGSAAAIWKRGRGLKPCE